MRIYKTVLVFFIILAIARCVSAQWMGSDGPPVEPAQERVAYLGSDRTASDVPGGPSAVVTVMGEGYPTPPVYAVGPEQIAALKLNKKQEVVLKAEFPGFIPWNLADYGDRIKYYPFSKRQLPYVLSWDFDGKNNPAIAVTGHDAENNYIVILKPEEGGYKIIKWRTYSEYPKNIPVLRLIKKGSVIRLNQNCDPPDIKEIWHQGFADMEVEVSTRHSPVEWLQADITNSIIYYHEGLFPLDSVHINGFRSDSPAAFKERYLKDILPTVDMANALARYNKNFKIWDNHDYPPAALSVYHYSAVSLPYAIKYDLNGDGIEDMVVAGHDNDSNMVLELLSGTSGYYIRSVENEPCYSSARERKEALELRPSHILSLYKNGTEFTSLSSEALKGFWRYNGDLLIGLRTLNTCLEPQKPPKTDLEERLCGSVGYKEYGKWRVLPGTEKEEMLIYGEKDESEGYGCLGSDSCRLELLPPGSVVK